MKSLVIIATALALLSPAPVCAAKLGSPDEAMKALKKSAMDEQLQGHADAALDLYDKLVSLASEHYGPGSVYVGQLYYEMGALALQATKFQRAEAYLAESVKLRPGSADARTKLAELLMLRGRPDEAREQAEKALAKHGDHPAARLAYATALNQLGDTARANRAYANLSLVLSGKKAPKPKPPKPPKPAPPPVAPLPTEDSLVQPEAAPEAPAAPKPVKPEKKPAAPPQKKPAKPAPKKPDKVGKPPVEKPKAKAPEPKPAAPTKPAAKPAELTAKPQELKAKPAPKLKPARVPGGLVPPPPPVMPVFPGQMVPPPPPMVGAGNPGFTLKTDAKVKEKAKPKKDAEEKPAHASGGGEDPDFLLDWADDKGSKKKKKSHSEEE